MRRHLCFAIISALLFAGCTGSGSEATDRDGDGVKDEVETQGRVVTIHLLGGPVQRTLTSDPEKKDTDGDGLGDADEMLVRGSDPRDVDTDDDGLLDGQDVRSPDEATSDAWRRAGIVEVDGVFLGELNGCNEGGFQLKPNVASSDLPLPDELADGEEIRGWDILSHGAIRHVTSDPCAGDTDGDGLADHDEKLLLADPRNADTDNDGARDSSDADPVMDLVLGLRELRANASNATAIRLVFVVSQATASLTSPGNSTTTLDVPDTSATRDSLVVNVLITAENVQTGEPLRLFPDPRGVVLGFDLVQGTVEGVESDASDPRRLLFAGADGDASFLWETVRR